MLKEFLECGKIINKRGFSGELKLLMLCDSVEALKDVKVLYSSPDFSCPHKVESIKSYKGFLYIKLEDIDSAEKADIMRGKSLFAKREDLKIDKGRVFIEDIIGLEVIDADTGKVYGILKEVFNSGSCDIYRVSKEGAEYLMPAVSGILIKAIPGEKILVRPIPGIFDDAEEIR